LSEPPPAISIAAKVVAGRRNRLRPSGSAGEGGSRYPLYPLHCLWSTRAWVRALHTLSSDRASVSSWGPSPKDAPRTWGRAISTPKSSRVRARTV
jgi:hypothetical protein